MEENVVDVVGDERRGEAKGTRLMAGVRMMSGQEGSAGGRRLGFGREDGMSWLQMREDAE